MRACAVAAHRGQYCDALENKKNDVILLLHDNYGGVAPLTYRHLCVLGRATRTRDGTTYDSWAAPSFVPHYGQKLSSAAVFQDAAIIRDGIATLRANTVVTG